MIIGITGLKGSGKDTAAQYFIDNHNYVKIAFADKLKEAVAKLFGLTVEQVDDMKHIGVDNLPMFELFLMKMGSSTEWSYDWRYFLQRFGTEMGRNTFGEDFWIDQWEKSYYELQMQSSAYKPVVVPDVRFVNEAERITAVDGRVLEIVRPGLVSDGHASEQGVAAHYTFLNDGTIEDLHTKLEEWYNGL